MLLNLFTFQKVVQNDTHFLKCKHCFKILHREDLQTIQLIDSGRFLYRPVGWPCPFDCRKLRSHVRSAIPIAAAFRRSKSLKSPPPTLRMLVTTANTKMALVAAVAEVDVVVAALRHSSNRLERNPSGNTKPKTNKQNSVDRSLPTLTYYYSTV